MATPLNKACTDIADRRDLRLPSLSPRPPQNNPPNARPTRVILPKMLYYLASREKFAYCKCRSTTDRAILFRCPQCIAQLLRLAIYKEQRKTQQYLPQDSNLCKRLQIFGNNRRQPVRL